MTPPPPPPPTTAPPVAPDTHPAGGATWNPAAPAGRGEGQAIVVVAALVAALPLLLAAFFAIAAPGFLEPLFDEQVTIAGVTFIVPLLAACVLGVVLSVALASWRRAPWLGIVVAVLWAGVGTFAVIFGPAVVLIIIGLRGST
jgi:hypothetical protein